MAILPEVQNPIRTPSTYDPSSRQPAAEAHKIRVSNLAALPGGDNSVEDWLQSLQSSYGLVVQPPAFHVVFLSSGGDDAKNGTTFPQAVASLGRAMTLAKAIVPTTDHRTIFSLEARNFGDLTNPHISQKGYGKGRCLCYNKVITAT